MKRAFLIITLACAVAVASALDNRRKSKPSATVSPPGDFDAPNTTTHAPNTTTHAPNTTTHAPNTTTHAPNTTTHAPNTTTHAPNTTTHAPNTTTHAPNTTTHAPNTTTHAPNTTTHAPNTTTHAPNTTTHAPNTTTHAPNTTTTHAPTPPTPTPPTNLTVGTYVVKNDTVMCGKAAVAIQIKLQSSTKPSEMGSFIIQPNKTVAVGQCTDATSNFTLSFPEGTLTLLFQKNVTEKSVYITKVAFDVNYPILPSGPTQNSVSNESLHLLSTTIGHSYSCKNMTLFMGSGYFLEMTSLRLQAFNFTNGDFGLPDNCPADKPDYTVAIVVAVVLIILIVIVIVVYLIGRKKRTDGYQAL